MMQMDDCSWAPYQRRRARWRGQREHPYHPPECSNQRIASLTMSIEVLPTTKGILLEMMEQMESQKEIHYVNISQGVSIMIQVAIMGYGTVGSGQKSFTRTGRGIKRELKEDMEVKYILDLRDFPGDPEEKKIVHDFDIIVNDPEIDIVQEHGEVLSLYSKRALEAVHIAPPIKSGGGARP